MKVDLNKLVSQKDSKIFNASVTDLDAVYKCYGMEGIKRIKRLLHENYLTRKKILEDSFRELFFGQPLNASYFLGFEYVACYLLLKNQMDLTSDNRELVKQVIFGLGFTVTQNRECNLNRTFVVSGIYPKNVQEFLTVLSPMSNLRNSQHFGKPSASRLLKNSLEEMGFSAPWSREINKKIKEGKYGQSTAFLYAKNKAIVAPWEEIKPVKKKKK